jgi:hypothetical protein
LLRGIRAANPYHGSHVHRNPVCRRRACAWSAAPVDATYEELVMSKGNKVRKREVKKPKQDKKKAKK